MMTMMMMMMVVVVVVVVVDVVLFPACSPWGPQKGSMDGWRRDDEGYHL